MSKIVAAAGRIDAGEQVSPQTIVGIVAASSPGQHGMGAGAPSSVMAIDGVVEMDLDKHGLREVQRLFFGRHLCGVRDADS